jgi:chromosome segregation and condensation protein ScpB
MGQLFYKLFTDIGRTIAIIDYNQPAAKIRNYLNKKDTGNLKDFYNKEIIAQAGMNNIKGDTAKIGTSCEFL